MGHPHRFPRAHHARPHMKGGIFPMRRRQKWRRNVCARLLMPILVYLFDNWYNKSATGYRYSYVIYLRITCYGYGACFMHGWYIVETLTHDWGTYLMYDTCWLRYICWGTLLVHILDILAHGYVNWLRHIMSVMAHVWGTYTVDEWNFVWSIWLMIWCFVGDLSTCLVHILAHGVWHDWNISWVIWHMFEVPGL